MEIKTYYNLRETQPDKISLFKGIAKKLGIYQNEDLIVWFMNRFSKHNEDYFKEWCRRYNDGTQSFISRMDNIVGGKRSLQ